MGVCYCSMFCCTLLYVHCSNAIILMGKRELVALLNLSSWCLVMVERLFLAVPLGCLWFVIVVFPDHTHLLFLMPILETRSEVKVTVTRKWNGTIRNSKMHSHTKLPSKMHLYTKFEIPTPKNIRDVLHLSIMLKTSSEVKVTVT